MSVQYHRPGSRKPPTPDLDALTRALAALPVATPEPRTDTQRYLVERLRGPLREAQARGYSLARLAAILTRAGLAVRASTLRQYLGPINPRQTASDG